MITILQCPGCQNPAVKTSSGRYECMNPDCYKEFSYNANYQYADDAKAKHRTKTKYKCGVCGQMCEDLDTAFSCSGACAARICPDCFSRTDICADCAATSRAGSKAGAGPHTGRAAAGARAYAAASASSGASTGKTTTASTTSSFSNDSSSSGAPIAAIFLVLLVVGSVIGVGVVVVNFVSAAASGISSHWETIQGAIFFLVFAFVLTLVLK